MAFLQGVGGSGTLTYKLTPGARYAREDKIRVAIEKTNMFGVNYKPLAVCCKWEE